MNGMLDTNKVILNSKVPFVDVSSVRRRWQTKKCSLCEFIDGINVAVVWTLWQIHVYKRVQRGADSQTTTSVEITVRWPIT